MGVYRVRVSYLKATGISVETLPKALKPSYEPHTLDRRWKSSAWLQSLSPLCVCVRSLQLCLILCNSIDGNPPGPFVHVILPARILKWVAISSSRGSSQPGKIKPTSPALEADSLPAEPSGKPYFPPCIRRAWAWSPPLSPVILSFVITFSLLQVGSWSWTFDQGCQFEVQRWQVV